ncbi:MAG: hypothetical protein GQE15_10815 [Archangiaceae bacterium]|nr:hypothetical protein [Archangiaceae bacterium]
MNRFFLLLCLSTVVAACTCNPPCTPGAKDCACKEASVCNDGLVCGSMNTCVSATTVGVQVSDANARGCEVLLAEAAGSTVTDVSFAKGVQGAYVREAPKVAFSFVAPADARLPSEGVSVSIAGAATGVTVAKATCVDSAGQKLAGATVTIR